MGSDFQDQKLDAAIRAAIAGTATLFVGAGVSFLAKNSDGKALPNGEGFSDILHDICGIERRKHSLSSISDYYRTKYGSAALTGLIQKEFEAKEVDERLQAFYQLPWRRIYTTNYDLVIENSQKSKNPQNFSHLDKPRNVGNGAIIHLNGRLDNAIPESIDEDIRLTDRSYGLSNLQSSPWMQLFLSDVKVSKAIIFIGYSLSDLDISRALIADANLCRKTIIFVGPGTDEVDLSRISKYGLVRDDGVDFLFSKLDTVDYKHIQSGTDEQLLVCSELSLGDPDGGASPAELVFDQLVYGSVPLQEILSNVSALGPQGYLVERSDIKQCFAAGLDKFRDIFISGEFASGKTYGLIQVARFALEQGARVFWVDDGPELAHDLNIIAKIDGDVWLICDNYGGKIDTLKTYIKQRNIGQRLVLAERTASHELIRSAIEGEAAAGPFKDVVFSRINVEEAPGFDTIIDFAGLWGAYAGMSPSARSKIIFGDLGGSLYRLLLEIIKSKKVQEEIEKLLGPLQDDEDAMRFFVTALIVKVMGFDFWINDWQTFYSVPNIRKILEKYKSGISHFVNLDSSQVHLRSGIVSQYILRNFTTDTMVLDCLVDMYDCASRNLFNDDGFSEIAFELRHYNRVEPLFSEKNKLYYLKRYFQEIRSFPKTVNNSDYWLQYGIAMSIHGDLDTAREAFSTAYAKEGAREKPNLIKIDNYFARFELELAIHEDDSNIAYKLAQSGANKLERFSTVLNRTEIPTQCNF